MTPQKMISKRAYIRKIISIEIFQSGSYTNVNLTGD